MNALQTWLAKTGPAGRKELLAELRKVYPQTTSTSISQYAHGKRIPDQRRAEIIARVTGMSLEAIPFRTVHRPEGLVRYPQSSISKNHDSHNGGRLSVRKITSFFRRLFFFANNSDK